MPAQANSIAPFWDDRQLAYGHDVRSSQELLEHKDIKTTAIETP
jgi:site-specific recombinase XerC